MLKTLGGGILVLAVAPDAIAAAWGQRRGGPPIPQEIGAWLHIADNGHVTVFTGKVEVGQNARTSITQAACEELRVSPEFVGVVMGDTDLVPYDMGTFGSRTTPTMLPQVRKAAAAARELLVDVAAKKSGLDRASLHAENGRVAGQNFSMTYGELAKGQSLDKTISNGTVLTPTDSWKQMGKPLPKVAAIEIVTGKHQYASDMTRPGMLHAKVLRPPSFGATLASLDIKAAEAMPGVHVVHEGDLVAVAAPTERAARAAIKAIKAEWNETKQPGHAELFTLLRGVDAAPPAATGEKTLQGTYRCEYIAHVPLEPRAALAAWDGKRITVYTGTQRPFAVRDEVAAATGLTAKDVRVIVPDTGSGYGGKHTGDAAVEAAKIAKATGKPVKIVWSRPEEFTWAYLRPAGIVEITSAITAAGRLQGWTQDNYNSGPAAIDTSYAVEPKHAQFHEADSPLRQGSYRSLAACFNNFARETHMDELAHMLGQDPAQFRLANIENTRLKNVLTAAADKFGWPAKAASGHGHGIACGAEKGSYVATAVEIAVEGKDVKLVRAVIAYECGAIVNPDLLKNQVVGALIMGIGGALFEEIDFGNGRILTDRLSKYRVPRYADVPPIECLLLDRKDLPSVGAGETPIIGIAPAIGNAIFDATGIRLRALPLKLS
ncbi:MAG TPA: molybdopterin cofactor-binding domain-containing protein [Fimbriimonadaceae bacterium]|nr:molybdopterin cofactor-binding domain-containing protein [Fimbriimonadaceae bacterium]